MKELSDWQSFYAMVGSSAGALIGLQFVLISLIARDRSGASEAGRAFSTPTVVHFTAVLLLAGVGTAPWHSAEPVALLWGVGGVAGLVYEIWVVRRMSRQRDYKPQAEDWLFHGVLPVMAYGALGASAFYEKTERQDALFAVAGTVLLLLVIGIHNAWDAASYHVFNMAAKSGDDKRGR